MESRDKIPMIDPKNYKAEGFEESEADKERRAAVVRSIPVYKGFFPSRKYHD